MIVDTSALIAVLLAESGHDAIITALATTPGRLPAPARLEFVRVASGKRLRLKRQAEALLDAWDRRGLETLAFTAAHADRAASANALYGKGNGRGGQLNLLDLMVYAVAIERGEPLLFTGRDFAATDIVRHPASRVE